jgi:hypothetical protein
MCRAREEPRKATNASAPVVLVPVVGLMAMYSSAMRLACSKSMARRSVPAVMTSVR